MIDRIGCIDRKTGYLDIQTLIRSDFYLRITGKDERFYVVLKIHWYPFSGAVDGDVLRGGYGGLAPP